MNTYHAQPHGPANEEAPPPPNSGWVDPGGGGTDNCVCSTEIIEDLSCISDKRVNKNCDQCSSSSLCAEDLGVAPLWIQVMSVEPGFRRSWKGSQYEDSVKVDPTDTTPWSYPGSGGGIDDEGYFKYYRPYYRDDEFNRTWEFDKNSNRIDASGTMNVWVEGGLGHEEYWSNHFCGNGRAWNQSETQKYPFAGGGDRYKDQTISGNSYGGRNIAPYFIPEDEKGPNRYSFCQLNPTKDYCMRDYDGCIDDFSGGKSCVGDYCNASGYHAYLNEHGDFEFISGGAHEGPGWWDPYRGLLDFRFQGRWLSTYQIYGDGTSQGRRFNVNLRAPLGYLCRIADARRIDDHAEDEGEMETQDTDGDFFAATRDRPRCTWRADNYNDGEGHGIMLSFLISKDPNYNPTGWYKVRDAAFHKKGQLIVTYPAVVDPYDIDDNGKAYPLINSGSANNAGLTTVADDTFIASGNKDEELAEKRDDPDTPEDEGAGGQVGKVSPKNWRLSNYDLNPPYLSNLDDYLAVLRGQKTTTPITNVNQIQGNTINIFTGGNFTLDTPLPDRGSPYVVFVDGDLTLGPGMGAAVNTTGDSVALIATGNINIHSTITQIDAIMIGNGFNLASDLAIGTNSAIPLKINGNLVSNTAVQTWRRDRPDYEKPSLFVVFKPKMYLDLMPLLSVTENR